MIEDERGTACWGYEREKKYIQGLVGKPEEKNYSQDLGIVWRIIEKLIFKENDEKLWTRHIWFRIETMTDSCKYSNKPLGSTKVREYLD
jgi:predicted methyltransferase